MKSSLFQHFSVDKDKYSIQVERTFAAPLPRVWAAWTQPELLDQWWAPQPWKARTQTMDFREGGHWLYAMTGPDGGEHWARVDYLTITPLQSFSALDAFCDAQGTIDASLPRARWQHEFRQAENSTLVSVRIQYDSLADLEQILAMGFQEGFTTAQENLEALLQAS